jgi:lipopolysaccharide export system permease protein
MLFHSSIRKELARSFVATLVVLITVVMSMMLIRTLGLAAKGSVNPSDVIMLMGYAVLGNLATIMTLSLFIAVTNTLSRMYRESEMAVWFSSGQGMASFISPVLRFAWPILLAIAGLALIVWPWSAQQTAKLRYEYEQRSDLDRLAMGQFQENSSGSRVFYVEGTDKNPAFAANGNTNGKTNGSTNSASNAPTSTVTPLGITQARNIFMSANEKDRQIITSARSGQLETLDGDQFLVLSNGQRMEQSTLPGKTEVKVSEFEKYSVLINPKKIAENTVLPPKNQNSLTLLQTNSAPAKAELSWRIGLALSACNLLLIALLLSAVNPRAGRSFGIGFALLAFVAYYNMLNVGYSRVANGRTDWLVWLLMLHGGVLAVTVLWMAKRHFQWSWRYLLPRPKMASVA